MAHMVPIAHDDFYMYPVRIAAKSGPLVSADQGGVDAACQAFRHVSGARFFPSTSSLALIRGDIGLGFGIMVVARVSSASS